jgi:hypothetical protein
VLTSNKAPPPRITNIVRTNNAVFMQWSGPTNAQFQVQWQPALTLGWNTFSNTITSPAGQFSFLDNGTQTGGLGAMRFYRLVQLPRVGGKFYRLTRKATIGRVLTNAATLRTYRPNKCSITIWSSAA